MNNYNIMEPAGLGYTRIWSDYAQNLPEHYSYGIISSLEGIMGFNYTI